MKPSLMIAVVLLGAALWSRAAGIADFAGNGLAGSGGDAGQAVRATLGSPFGVVRGPDGAICFCDYSNHVVRRVGRDGVITTVAGNGRAGYSGDGGAATNASLREPHELRFDRAGNLVIADTGNHAIRRLDLKTGVLSTIAGTGKVGYSGDGGRAELAEFRSPISIQFASSGDLFIADIGNHVIRRVDARSGVITTFAGTGKAGPTPAASPIPGTPLNGPRSLDFDAAGNLWLATREGNQVLMFDLTKGVIRHIAGTGNRGLTGDGGPAAVATLNGPKGISLAPDGSAFLADTENHVIRRIDPKGMIEVVAGTGEAGNDPAGDPLKTRLARPHGVFVDTDGSIFIGDSGNHRVRTLWLRPRSNGG